MDQEQAEAEGSNNDKSAKAQEFKNSGNDKFNVYNYKGAIADYRKGLLHDPQNSDLHANLAAAYIQLEKYNDAEHYAVFAIHLKPNFYKGYMRAAKAAHGKGVTRLALKRLDEGLKKVTDPNGVKELTRLKKQYTSYLSLKRNADQELDFDSDRYHSEDEDEDQYSDEDQDLEDDEPEEPVVLPEDVPLPVEEAPILPVEAPKKPKSSSKTEEPDVVKVAKPKLAESNAKPSSKEEQKKEEQKKTVPPVPTSERKSSISGKDAARVQQEEPKETTNAPSKSVEKGVTLDIKEASAERPMTEFLRDVIKDPELKKHVAEFKDHLKTGSDAFLSGNYRKAVESYKAAKERVGIKFTDYEIDDRLYHVIKYAHCAALISLGTYDDIIKAIHILTEMEIYKCSIPALYIQFARAYYKLNRFKAALEPLEKLQEIVENFPIFPTFTWPGTSETIQETTPTGLKNAIKELHQMCRMPHKPTAVCRYDNCLQTSAHILPSDVIYESDPDFIGFVRMICEEKCHIEFHVSCWKSYKESIGIGKINDKDFLGRRCLTTDCVNSEGEPSLITIIEIIDSDGQVKSTNKLETKTTVDSKKAKKKKVKLDDKENKEKAVKPKKPKEKKAREVKKPVTVAEEEEEPVEPVRVFIDPVFYFSQLSQPFLIHRGDKPVEPSSLVSVPPILISTNQVQTPKGPSQDPASVSNNDEESSHDIELQRLWKALQTRKQALAELRTIRFGLGENYWSPKALFYARTQEAVKALAVQFLDEVNREPAVRDAKEFLFSYFLTILKDEGPLKQSEVEDLWKSAAGDFCDITVVLPNLKSMCELLTESTRFCQLEDYICLADQLEEAYSTMKMEVSETVNFLMTGSASAAEEEQQISNMTQLPDLLNYPSSAKTQFLTSDEDSESDEDDSEDSDEDASEEEEDNATQSTPQTEETPSNLVAEEMPTINPPKPLEDGKFSLQEMLSEMTRVKSFFMKGPEERASVEKTDDLDVSKDKTIDSTSTDTFDTAHGSSLNSTEDIKNGSVTDRGMSESSNDEPEQGPISNDEQASDNKDADQNNQSIANDQPEQSSFSDIDSVETIKGTSDEEERTVRLEEETVKMEEVTVKKEEVTVSDADSSETAKATQNEVQPTKEKPKKETKDSLCQTKESELYKKLVFELGTLRVNVKDLTQENCVLRQEKGAQEELNKKLKSEHEQFISHFKEETRKNVTALKTQQSQLKVEFNKKEQAFKQKELESSRNVARLEGMYASLLSDNEQLKNEIKSLLQDRAEVQKSLTSAMSNVRGFEANYKKLEKNMILRLQKSQEAQLHTIKVFWETQINLLRKRCVEKISEMQSWFSMFPEQEVEELPSWGAIYNYTVQWREISKAIQLIESNFQEIYNTLEGQVARGEEVDEFPSLILPTLPEEPAPFPLDQIHREITEKHLKKIGELTQLVANQQLEIEKTKETNQQIQQMMGNIQLGMPRMQTPMTTAFGGLALQYSYPGSLPSPYAQNSVPTISAQSQNATKTGSAAKLLQADVQTLLQESSKAAKFTNLAPGKQPGKDESLPARVQTPPVSSSAFTSTFSFMNPPPPLIPSAPGAPPPVTMPPMNLPPPPVMGVAQNVLKSSSALTDKKEAKPVERSITPGTSRESTPVPGSATAPTPEKSAKKKKKARSQSREPVEVRMSTPVNVDASMNNHEDPKDEDFSGWNVVVNKPVLPKHTVQPSLPQTDSKLKNKKKLLDKLQLKFPTTTLRDLDDVVKLVREQNNGSLSGLPFDEIETRVERFLAKRHFQKTSTMGLVKFSEAAWGTVTQPEIITWNSLQLEECTICLEPMGDERTKVDCNHEFHTKCLRKWLKEKSVCPLCNKFTTMPDEFPAL